MSNVKYTPTVKTTQPNILSIPWVLEPGEAGELINETKLAHPKRDWDGKFAPQFGKAWFDKQVAKGNVQVAVGASDMALMAKFGLDADDADCLFAA